jgi:hypothetical protein
MFSESDLNSVKFQLPVAKVSDMLKMIKKTSGAAHA